MKGEKNIIERILELLGMILISILGTIVVVWLIRLVVGGFLALCKIIYLILFNL